MEKKRDLSKNKKTNNLLLLSLLISSIFFIIIILFFILSSSNIKKNDKNDFFGSLPSLIGKPSNIYDSKSGIGKFCNEFEDNCAGCLKCDPILKKCVEMNEEIDPDFCKEGLYEGTLALGKDCMCISGVCGCRECIPNCSNKECGPDGCGGSCGECSEGLVCNNEGKCEINYNNHLEKNNLEKKEDINLLKISNCKKCPENSSYISPNGTEISRCCLEQEICFFPNKNFPPFCFADKSKYRNNWDYCTGSGIYEIFSKWCHVKFTYCSKDKKLRPKCLLKPEIIVGNPSYSYPNSIYMIRSKNFFTLNGNAYVIKSNLKLNKPLKVTFDYSDYNKDNVIFKYPIEKEVLSLCSYTIKNSLKKQFDTKGGNLKLNDILIEVQKDVIKNNSNFDLIIEEYELSNCLIDNIDDNLYEIIDLKGGIESLLSDYEINYKIPTKNKSYFLVIISTIFIIFVILLFLLMKFYRKFKKQRFKYYNYS
ncbi:MAG: hypothetical protein QXW97_03170 [Candidatus Pacearchaeota archaeon]